MMLLTKAILDTVPELYTYAETKAEDVPIAAKFFTPWTCWTWYMTEYDPETTRAFGLVVSSMCPDGELGYFMLSELEEIRGAITVRFANGGSHTGPRCLKVERDRHFTGTLGGVMADVRGAA